MGTNFNIDCLLMLSSHETVIFVPDMIFDFHKRPDGIIVRMFFAERFQEIKSPLAFCLRQAYTSISLWCQHRWHLFFYSISISSPSFEISF